MVVAGGDCIDDVDGLRAGATASVLGHGVVAASTIGTWLRAFTFGHVRQLDRVAETMLTRAWAAGVGPGDDVLTIDMDSTIVEVHGKAKQGASYGYTRQLGLHPLLATRADTGEVLHARTRTGSAGSGRGAAATFTGDDEAGMVMAEGHEHGSAAAAQRAGATYKRRLMWALRGPWSCSRRPRLVLIAGYFLVELVGGLVTNSLALLSDAGHMFTDVLGLGMALAAIHAASSASDRPERTFGLYRLEILAALANAVLLFGVAIWITVEAVRRFGDPPEVLGAPMLVVAVIGLAINLVAFWLLRDGANESRTRRRRGRPHGPVRPGRGGRHPRPARVDAHLRDGRRLRPPGGHRRQRRRPRCAR